MVWLGISGLSLFLLGVSFSDTEFKKELDKKDQEAIKGIHSTFKLPGIKGIKKPNLPEDVEFSDAELAHIDEIMNSDKATVAAKAVNKPEMKALNLSHGLPKGVK